MGLDSKKRGKRKRPNVMNHGGERSCKQEKLYEMPGMALTTGCSLANSCFLECRAEVRVP